MKSFGGISGAWVLAITLGLTAASCVMQKSAVLIKDKEPPHKQQTQTLTSNGPDAAIKAKVQVAYGKLPLSFEANQGQTDEQVKFLSRGSGYTLFLTSTEAVLALKQRSAVKIQDSRPLSPPPSKGEGQGGGAVLRMQLVGANPDPQVMGLDELPGKSNYFIGSDPKNWHTNIPTYARAQYKDIYPGVDLVYYGNQRQLEYDFVVAPGADPGAIKLSFDGLVGAGLVPAQEGRSQGSPLQIDARGDLILHTEGGEVRLLKPRIYQEINGIKQPIPGGYVLLSPQSSSLVTFRVAAYDTTKPLIIDPTLSYSTYLGGSGGDTGLDIAVDSSGNVYVTGSTDSTNFPTASPLQAAYGGGQFDAFVTKLNAAGSALLYSTYLGGSGLDYTEHIVVDTSGNTYMIGHTASANFPTASPIQAAFSGVQDAFVAKLNATGSTLLYSTYLGGSGDDVGLGIAVDTSGNAYVAGYTSSTNFPTVSPLQAVNGGGYDAFVTKVNAAGSVLTYSTYLGVSGRDEGFGIAVDTSGNAYVAGRTDSTNFPTASPLQAAIGGGQDAFVAKITDVKEVPLDIKPQSCPNPLNTNSKGVVPVAILGTASFDVTQVNVATVKLEGVSPLSSAFADVATPFVPFTGKVDCKEDCTTAGPDGFLDLTLKFKTQAVVAALGPVSDKDCLVLGLTGNLLDGTSIVGEDVVIILKKK